MIETRGGEVVQRYETLFYCQALVLGKLGRGLAATLGCAYHCTGPKEDKGNRGLVVDEVSRTIV